jgi:hypothetical protein
VRAIKTQPETGREELRNLGPSIARCPISLRHIVGLEESVEKEAGKDPKRATKPKAEHKSHRSTIFLMRCAIFLMRYAKCYREPPLGCVRNE